MKKHRILAITILILTFFFHTAKNVSAVELITNGGFETADFTGWTAVNGAGGSSWYNWNNTAGGFNTSFHTSSPQQGTRSAWNGVAGNAGAVFTLTQQVSISSGNSASLTWRHRFQLDNNQFCNGAACGTATFAVQILNTSDVLLQTLYTVTVGPDQVFDSGWLINNVNLNSYAGQTIRLRFRNTVPQTLAGPGMAEIDAVSLNALPNTAANVSVSGRVFTANGNGIRNAVVTLTDSNGVSRSVFTGSFGSYRFDEVPAGETYVVSVTAKKFNFDQPSRILTVNEDAVNTDFVAIE